MKQIIFFILIAFLSQNSFAQSYTLTAKCSGWKMESGEGQIRVLEDPGSDTALIVFDQLSGQIYSENATVAQIDRSQPKSLELYVPGTVGSPSTSPIRLKLREGKDIPTALLQDGKQNDLLCSYGYGNL